MTAINTLYLKTVFVSYQWCKLALKIADSCTSRKSLTNHLWDDISALSVLSLFGGTVALALWQLVLYSWAYWKQHINRAHLIWVILWVVYETLCLYMSCFEHVFKIIKSQVDITVSQIDLLSISKHICTIDYWDHTHFQVLLMVILYWVLYESFTTALIG